MNTDDTDRAQEMTPLLGSVKRKLDLSPSTPVGLLRKQLLTEGVNKIGEINYGDDVEMVDLGMSPVLKGDLRPTASGVNNRKVLKGLRRQLEVNKGEQGSPSSTKVLDEACSTDAKSPSDRNTQKGTSIKNIKHRLKDKRVSYMEKKCVNFKTRKKKKKNTRSDVDNSQRMIYEFFPSKTNNNIFAGLDDDQDGPVLHNTCE